MICLKNSKQHINIEKSVSDTYSINRIVRYTSFAKFIKTFFLLSNIFLINCSITESEKKDTIDHLYKQLIDLGNQSYDQHKNELKKYKNTKIFAFDEIYEENSIIPFKNKDLKFFEYISTNIYDDGVYITCGFFKEESINKKRPKHTIINFLVEFRNKIMTNKCREYDGFSNLTQYEENDIMVVEPIFLKKQNIPIFFEKIEEVIEETTQELMCGFILLTNYAYSDSEISVVCDHILYLRTSIIWICKDEEFINPLTYISHNLEFKKIDLNFTLYDFNDPQLNCSDPNKKTIRIKRYYERINEEYLCQHYTSLRCGYYVFFLFSFYNKTVTIQNGFLKISLSKRELNNHNLNYKKLDESQLNICSFSVNLYFNHKPTIIYILFNKNTSKIVYTTKLTYLSTKTGMKYEHTLDKRTFLSLIMNIIFYFEEEGVFFKAYTYLMLFLGHKGQCFDFRDNYIMIPSDEDIIPAYHLGMRILIDSIKTFMNLNRHNFVFSVIDILNDEKNLIKGLRPEIGILHSHQFCNDQKENEIYDKMINGGYKYIYSFNPILNKQEMRVGDIIKDGKYPTSSPVLGFYLNITDEQTEEILIILITVSYNSLSKYNHFCVCIKSPPHSNELINIQEEFMSMFQRLMSRMKKKPPISDFTF